MKNKQLHLSDNQKKSIRDVLMFADVLKDHFPGIDMTEILTDHIVQIAETDIDDNTIYDEIDYMEMTDKKYSDEAFDRLMKELAIDEYKITHGFQ